MRSFGALFGAFAASLVILLPDAVYADDVYADTTQPLGQTHISPPLGLSRPVPWSSTLGHSGFWGGPQVHFCSHFHWRPLQYFAPAYGVRYQPRTNDVEYFLPPSFYPAELNYGPQALTQFYGLGRNFININQSLGRLSSGVPKVVATTPVRPAVRISNPETRQRGRKLVEMGDRLYRMQRYHEALQQYKSAARIAPDLEEAHFRQGHALVATNRYELAVKAFRRGLSLNPGYTDSGFQLDTIYGAARLAKLSHLEVLARQALERTDDVDTLFLLGLFLHFDGQTDRALKFFQRAADFQPTDSHLVALLKRP